MTDTYAIYPPEFLFRYRSSRTEYFFDEIEKAVGEAKIFLTPASGQNDPYEMRPVYEVSAMREVNKWVRAHEPNGFIDRERYQEISGRG